MFNKKQNLDEYLDGYKHKKTLGQRISEIFSNKTIDINEIMDELLEELLQADISIDLTQGILDQLKENINKKKLFEQKEITNELIEIIADKYQDFCFNEELNDKQFIMMVGINGSGKTTTIAKLANRYLKQGKKVGLIAADTFRAGAVDQLKAWAERLNIDCYGDKSKNDPSSVLTDGCRYFKENPVDIIIADTAGRLQNKASLMKELEKMVRVVNKETENINLNIWLSLDSTTGQNGSLQAEGFMESSKLTGVILTKIDGTSKGGVALAINNKYHLPIVYTTYGEDIEAIKLFNKDEYARRLVNG